MVGRFLAGRGVAGIRAGRGRGSLLGLRRTGRGFGVLVSFGLDMRGLDWGGLDWGGLGGLVANASVLNQSRQKVHTQ